MRTGPVEEKEISYSTPIGVGTNVCALRVDKELPPIEEIGMTLHTVLAVATCLGCLGVAGPARADEGKVLNNLVSELLNVENPAAGVDHPFTNPRRGFIFVRAEGGDAASQVIVGDPDKRVREVAMRPVGKNYEGMLHCPKGPHRIVVRGARARLVVRAVGELFYDVYSSSANPYCPEIGVPGRGTYDWQWLREHVLDHYNAIIAHDNTLGHRDEIREWTSEGKWWVSRTNLKYYTMKQFGGDDFERNVESQYTHWMRTPGARDPLMNGFWIDEFSHGPDDAYDAKRYPIYQEAMRRITNGAAFKGRRIYAYTTSRYTAPMADWIRFLVGSDSRICREWYLGEIRSAKRGQSPAALINENWEMGRRHDWETAAPGAHSSNLIVVLGTFSSPPESKDTYPDYNYNVFLDMQMQFVATSPVYEGAAGVVGYYSPYMAEEQMRLLARLVRHYAIEGRKDRLLDDPYELDHVTNPDFRDGTSDWELAPAEPDAIRAVIAKGFGILQGRSQAHIARPEPAHGDTALLTRRGESGPNRFAQELRKLQPGRLYSLRFFTGNYRDLVDGRSREYKHSLSVQIDKGKFQARLAFDVHSAPAWTAKVVGPFGRKNPYGWNYHQRVFRATADTARLTFSDWASAVKPVGEVGEELIWNFIQVQPYFEAQPAPTRNSAVENTSR